LRHYYDTHTHVISPDSAKYPVAPTGGKQSDWSIERPVSYAQLLEAMDIAGVAKAVVVQASTAYGNDNSYAAEAIKAHPDRFKGVFSADVLAKDAVDQLRRWIDVGFSGLRLFTTGSTMPGQADWLDDERTFPAWKFCEAHNISVCLQMTADGIPALKNILARFPSIIVLLDHLARPTLSDGFPYHRAAPLFSLAAEPNVFLKLTNRTIVESSKGASTPDMFFPHLIKEFGADRIAWGSNFPSAEGSLSELLEAAQKGLSMLSESDQSSIFEKTAQKIYPFVASAEMA
jgi:L-fuconolactonase